MRIFGIQGIDGSEGDDIGIWLMEPFELKLDDPEDLFN